MLQKKECEVEATYKSIRKALKKKGKKIESLIEETPKEILEECFPTLTKALKHIGYGKRVVQ